MLSRIARSRLVTLLAALGALLFFAVAAILYSRYGGSENENTYYLSGEVEAPSEEDTERFEGIKLLEFTDTVKAGDEALLRISGEPGAVYEIKLYLNSGISANSELVPQTADGNGMAVWQWRVSHATSAGTYRLTVTSYENSGSGRVRSYSEYKLKITSADGAE